MAILFLPGTFVHEVSHFLSALFLLVPVGNMQLVPKIDEESVRLGSVSIAKTDPLRRFLIGGAPLYIGVSIIIAIFYFASFQWLMDNPIYALLIFYVVFTVSGSMFSSKRDMEGLWGFVFVVLFFLICLWFLGVEIDISNFLSRFSEVFESASLFLTIPILIDIFVISILPKR